MNTVIKRNGSEAEFDKSKIYNAIEKANESTGKHLMNTTIRTITDKVTEQCSQYDRPIDVEEIQDMIEQQLYKKDFDVMKNFITYRHTHTLQRSDSTLLDSARKIIDGASFRTKEENANKNPFIVPTQRDYLAGELDKALAGDILSEDILKADELGIIHKHDKDYIRQHMTNCGLVNLDDMLQNFTALNGVGLHKPHSFLTAVNIATQIIAAVASSQYGGQTISLCHLAKFIDVSRKQIEKEVLADEEIDGITHNEANFRRKVERRLRKEVRQAAQMLQHQILSLSSTNGQSPFVTVFMYLNEAGDDKQLRDDLAMFIEEVLNQRIQGVQAEDGHWVSPAFPKLIYVTEPDNITEDTEYWYLTKLAAKCTNRRMVPDYISEKKMIENKGCVIPVMGCRSMLAPYKNPDGTYKTYGRFNLGVTTINLVDVALSSGGDFDKFWKLMDERLELCHKASEQIIQHLKNTKAKEAPALWVYGGYARLNPEDTIEQLFYNGNCSISLGYAGLYECVKYMTGESHTQEHGKEFGLKVMDALNDACEKWKEESPYKMGYGVYGTPMESTTYKFAKKLQNRFGEVEGITDRNYITNSYHIPVFEEIDAFDKLLQESEFQNKSLGGAISYVELPSMTDYTEALEELIKFTYDTIMYAEFNTKIDYCSKCGYDGEIEMKQDDKTHKLFWQCPHCGNTDTSTMTIVRRVCGYLSSNDFNQGRMGEMNDRVLHL